MVKCTFHWVLNLILIFVILKEFDDVKSSDTRGFYVFFLSSKTNKQTQKNIFVLLTSTGVCGLQPYGPNHPSHLVQIRYESNHSQIHREETALLPLHNNSEWFHLWNFPEINDEFWLSFFFFFFKHFSSLTLCVVEFTTSLGTLTGDTVRSEQGSLADELNH